MPTTVHIPDRLLAALDQRARALRVSRNRLIIRAVERVLEDTGEAWPEGFAERLTAVSPDEAATVDDLLTAVQRARRSKPPVTL